MAENLSIPNFESTTRRIHKHFILFYFILFYIILFYIILFYFILFYFILYYIRYKYTFLDSDNSRFKIPRFRIFHTNAHDIYARNIFKYFRETPYIDCRGRKRFSALFSGGSRGCGTIQRPEG